MQEPSSHFACQLKCYLPLAEHRLNAIYKILCGQSQTPREGNDGQVFITDCWLKMSARLWTTCFTFYLDLVQQSALNKTEEGLNYLHEYLFQSCSESYQISLQNKFILIQINSCTALFYSSTVPNMIKENRWDHWTVASSMWALCSPLLLVIYNLSRQSTHNNV